MLPWFWGACGLDGGIERLREGVRLVKAFNDGLCSDGEALVWVTRRGRAGPSSLPLGPLSVPGRVGAMLDNN